MQRRLLVVRIWRDERGVQHGLLSEPQSGWREPFNSPAELWRLLSTPVSPPEPAAPKEQSDGGSPLTAGRRSDPE